MSKIIVVAGNGLSIDLHKSYRHINKLNPSNPLEWEFEIEQQPNIKWQDAFPRFYNYKHTQSHLVEENDQFELFRKIKHPDFHSMELDIEARHFLALAYSHHARNTYVFRHWKWSRFFRRNSSSIIGAISFNYDQNLEDAFLRAGLTVQINQFHPERITVFKPHGSCHMDQANFDFGASEYPIKAWLLGNDGQIKYLPGEKLMNPRGESYCILPDEHNFFGLFQWQLPMWELFEEKLNETEHCIIIGHSYGIADRQEIDAIVDTLPKNATIHICNPIAPRSL